jgi:lipopolysaccharide transport system permease protein
MNCVLVVTTVLKKWIKLMASIKTQALDDLKGALDRRDLIGVLGWQDVKQRYRRSAIGPFWLTISMGIMIGTIGLVFGHIFKSPMSEYLPFLTIGMIVWAFITSVINEGCVGFISAEGIIKQLPIPLSVHILRILWRNIIIFFHNALIIPLVFLIMNKPFSVCTALAFPGLFLLFLNLAWIAIFLGVFCTRYRDMPQIVMSLLQVAYFLTPIIWMPSQMSEKVGMYLLFMNPAYHAIELIRAPLLGETPLAVNWIFSLGFMVVGWIFTLLFFGKFKRRIAYWL